MEDDALWHHALGDEAPERDQQFAGQGHDQLLAGVPVGAGALPVPLHERTVRLKPEKAPGELDHAVAHASIAGTCQSALTALGTALIRRSGQAAIACHRPPVRQITGKRLADEHVRRFYPKTPDPGQHPDPRVGRLVRCFREARVAGVLDLLDLLP